MIRQLDYELAEEHGHDRRLDSLGVDRRGLRADANRLLLFQHARLEKLFDLYTKLTASVGPAKKRKARSA